MLGNLKAYVPMKYKNAAKRVTAEVRSWLPAEYALPDFLIVGAMKSGTSALYTYLSRHPNILKPIKKDIHYFDNNFDRDISWYSSYFSSKAAKERLQKNGTPALTFEAGTYYIYHPLAPQRLFDLLPSAKIIMTLRNPVKRAVSHYLHNIDAEREKLSLDQAIHAEEGRLSGEEEKLINDPKYYSFEHENFSYLGRGVYIDQIKRWYELFPEENIMIFSFEELFQDVDKMFLRISEFLEIPQVSLPEYPVVGDRKKKISVDDSTIAYMKEYFHKPNQDLFAFLGRDLGWNR